MIYTGRTTYPTVVEAATGDMSWTSCEERLVNKHTFGEMADSIAKQTAVDAANLGRAWEGITI